MKLALVHEDLSRVGGAENVTLWMARALAERGHEVALVSTAFPKANDLPAIPIPSPGSSRRSASARAVARKLADLLEGFEVVNPNNFPASLWVHLACRELIRRPATVLTYQEPPRHLYEREMDSRYLASPLNRSRGPLTVWFDRLALSGLRRLEREAVRAAGRVVTNSEYTREKIREIYGVDAVVCPYGPPLPEAMDGDPEPGVLFTVCRLSRMKNVETLLEAFRLLIRRYPAARLRIAGRGDEEEELKRRAADLGDRVEFLGEVAPEALHRHYLQAQVVVYLPLEEPLGLVPIEAGHFGRPVVASDHGGPSFTVVDGETGLLVDPLDPEAVARRLEELLEDPERARAMGERARERMRRHYSLEGCVERFEKLLGGA